MKTRVGIVLLSLILTTHCGRRGDKDPGNTPANKAPTARAGQDRFAAIGQNLIFDGSLSEDADGEIRGYKWNFGDGSEPVTGKLAEYTYNQEGTFSVTLTVTDDDESASSDTVVIEVSAQNPTASFTLSAPNPEVGEEIVFSASASSGPHPIVNFDWNFGDSSEAGSGIQVEHAFEFAGQFKIRLEITDEQGRQGESEQWVTVTAPDDTAPNNSFSLAELQGLFALTADPENRTCQQYTVSIPDTLLTLSNGIDEGQCSEDEVPMLAYGASGNQYNGCFDGHQATLSFEESGVEPGGNCVTDLLVNYTLTFSTVSHFTGTASSFYSAAIGCQCSALFTIEGEKAE